MQFNMIDLEGWTALDLEKVLLFSVSRGTSRTIKFRLMATEHVKVFMSHSKDMDDAKCVALGDGLIEVSLVTKQDLYLGVMPSTDEPTDVMFRSGARSHKVKQRKLPILTGVNPGKRNVSEFEKMAILMNHNAERTKAAMEADFKRRLDAIEAAQQVVEPKPKPKPEPKPEPKSEPKPEPDPEPKPTGDGDVSD